MCQATQHVTPVGPVPYAPRVDFEAIDALRARHPAWRLLRANNASLVLSFLGAFFVDVDGTRFSADQVRFVNLIVDELTRNGVLDPGRLFESPYTDHAPTGPDHFFPDGDVDVIVEPWTGSNGPRCRRTWPELVPLS